MRRRQLEEVHRFCVKLRLRLVFLSQQNQERNHRPLPERVWLRIQYPSLKAVCVSSNQLYKHLSARFLNPGCLPHSEALSDQIRF